MNKFEDDLKYASKANGQEVLNWIQNVSIELIKQREYSYGQDFLKLQSSVYELMFKPDGIIHTSFRTAQQRFGSLEETIIFIRLLHQLSPEEQTFYSSLPSSYPLNQVQLEYLPAHIQLFLKDPNIANINPQFHVFSEIFKDNIIFEKNQAKFCVSPKMMFWIHLLNGAVNFKESAVNVTDNSQKLIDGAFARYKKRVNTKDHLLKQLTFNPYIVIIRRILESMVTQVRQNNIISNQNKQLVIFTFQQMIILLQEYILFEHVYVTKLIELNLSTEQQKTLNKIKPNSTISDTQMMLVYLTIFFNSKDGTELETIYSQFKPFLKNSEILFNKSQTVYLSRGFFFECGRQKQQLTFQQGLYKFLQHSFDVYHHERQCNQVTLLSHLSTYVLFLRGQYAKYELTLYNTALFFDKALLQCLASQNKVLNQLVQRQRPLLYQGNNPILRAFLNEIGPIWQICKDKFGEAPQTMLFRDFKPNFIVIPFDSKFVQNDYQLDYHYRELDSFRNQMNNLIRLHYPFYTKLLITILRCLNNLTSLSKTEYQGIIHLLTFLYSTEPDQFYCSLLKGLIVKPFQIPPYSEVKNFCDIYVSHSAEPDFLIKQNEDLKKYITQTILLLMQYQQQQKLNNSKLIQYLSDSFDIQVQKIKIVPGRITTSPQKSLGRVSRPKKSINQWKAPLRDDEFYILYAIMWWCSLFCDKIQRLPYDEYPITQWPRKFASPVNLFFIIFVFCVLIAICKWII